MSVPFILILCLTRFPRNRVVLGLSRLRLAHGKTVGLN
nr:MAG TPA: hypothetical protein [Caudoviricetes sp.]